MSGEGDGVLLILRTLTSVLLGKHFSLESWRVSSVTHVADTLMKLTEIPVKS
jgi:hypothetical protein